MHYAWLSEYSHIRSHATEHELRPLSKTPTARHSHAARMALLHSSYCMSGYRLSYSWTSISKDLISTLFLKHPTSSDGGGQLLCPVSRFKSHLCSVVRTWNDHRKIPTPLKCGPSAPARLSQPPSISVIILVPATSRLLYSRRLHPGSTNVSTVPQFIPNHLSRAQSFGFYSCRR